MKEIKLTQGKVAIVDDEDFEKINQHKWYCMTSGKGFRACRSAGGRKHKIQIYMHHDIAGKISGLHVDHINGDGLDNRADNLRWCLVKENIRNSRKKIGFTSKYKGVCWVKRTNRWHATITVDRVSKYIGSSKIEEEAAKMYKEAAEHYFGKFARTPGV